MGIGQDTFSLNKSEFTKKLGRIIQNFRASSKLIGEPKEFVLRCCRLTDQWSKLAADPDVIVYLRNVETAGGRKVKMISLERGGTRQPVPKQKLVDTLYPPKKIATSATVEEKHYLAVKAAMRRGVLPQLKEFRSECQLPIICSITGRKILPGHRTDVDHCGMTFSEIADEFIREKCLKYSLVTLKGPPTAKRFSDTALWLEWAEFHRDKARYSLVHASANRSKGSDGYTTPVDLIGSFKSDDPDCLSLDF